MEQIFIKKDNLNRWVAKYFKNKDLISIDDLLGVIEDLDGELECLQEQIEDMEQDIRDNYKSISKSEQYDIYENTFI